MRTSVRPGTLRGVKLLYHLAAAVVGLAVAALIVYLVFGSASEEGATQEGDAGSLAATGGLCGTVAPDESGTPEARKLAAENMPALFDQAGPIPAISSDQPEHQAWVERVHAASGLCLDELRIETDGTTAVMSTVDRVDEAAAARYAAGVLQQAFTPPINPRRVTLVATVGDSERTISMSARAWRAFQVRRRQLGLDVTVENIKLFRDASSFRPADLRIVGW